MNFIGTNDGVKEKKWLEQILVDHLNRTSGRIHWVIFVNFIICAIVYTNLYTSKLSYDNALIRAAPIFLFETEEKIRNLEKSHEGSFAITKPDGSTVLIAPLSQWESKDLKKYSTLIARQQRALAAIKSYTLEKPHIPLVELKISSTDLDIFCGVILVFTSIWLFFTINQIAYMFEDLEVLDFVSKHRRLLRHTFISLYSRDLFVRIAINFFIIFLPSITIFIVLRENIAQLKELGRDDSDLYSKYILEDIKALILRLKIILGILLFFAIAVSLAVKQLLSNLQLHAFERTPPS